MSTKPSPQLVLELESRILRALCTRLPAPDSRAAHDASTRAAILAQLRAHHWQDPEHRVVFEALTLLPGRHSAELREQLPAQATRMGFPDVNWDHYFAAATDNVPLESVVAELAPASREVKP